MCRYDIEGKRARLDVGPSDAGGDQFWGVTFRSLDPASGILRVVYGWNGGDRWVAPDNPRFTLRASRALYKMQLAARLPTGADPRDHDPCADFLEAFLPILDKALLEGKRG